MAKLQVAPNGYSPFEGNDTRRLLDEPRLRAIAAAHGVSAASVVLRWQWARHGVLVNPTATSEAHQRDNLRFLSGFALSERELDVLDAWPQSTPPATAQHGGGDDYRARTT